MDTPNLIIPVTEMNFRSAIPGKDDKDSFSNIDAETFSETVLMPSKRNGPQRTLGTWQLT